MPDLGISAAILTGTAVIVPALYRHFPRHVDSREVLCRTGTRLISEEEQSTLALRLIRSGVNITPEYFVGIRTALTSGYILICMGLLVVSAKLLVMLALSPLVFFIPSIWLKNITNRRQMRIKQDMGDFTVMMATALTAGINPVPALQEASAAIGGVLKDEMNRFIIEIMSGKSFGIAAMEICLRNDVDELANFIRTLEQIYIQGAPGAETMRIYSEQMRITRKFETMDRAGRLSVQLIFPVLLFILLPILIAIGYPAIYALLHAF